MCALGEVKPACIVATAKCVAPRVRHASTRRRHSPWSSPWMLIRGSMPNCLGSPGADDRLCRDMGMTYWPEEAEASRKEA